MGPYYAIFSHVEIVDVSYKSRTRSVNWDEKEKYLIIDCIRNHILTIENTRPDNDTNRKKKAVWQYVEQIFHDQGYNRDIIRIKEQWRRLKGLAKKEVQNYKRLLELKVHVEDLQRPCNLYFDIWDMLGDTQNVDANSDSEDSNPMKKQKTGGDWYAYPNQVWYREFTANYNRLSSTCPGEIKSCWLNLTYFPVFD